MTLRQQSFMSKKNLFTPRWVPLVNGIPRLEYGLWINRALAENAAREIATVTGATKVGACRVYYRVELTP